MSVRKQIQKQRVRRGFRVRNQVRRATHGKPRLSVFRSNNHIYAQIIDDVTGNTLVSASSLQKALFGAGQDAGNKDAAKKIGQAVAERALEKGVKEVVFDRGKYKFHGRVAALAEGARAGGLVF